MSEWTERRQAHAGAKWLEEPSQFAREVIEHLPKSGSLLELGAGLGRDSKFFADHGFDVTSTDLVLDDAIELPPTVRRQELDLTRLWPYDDKTFDGVYAHLSLHYFDHETTKRIFSEIHRVLKLGGFVALLVNSVDDSEYATGEQIEDHFFEIDGISKRFFTVEDMRNYANVFQEEICDNHGVKQKDQARFVDKMIRYVGRKQEVNEEIYAKGKMFELVHLKQDDGRVFEIARRAPGVRLIVHDKSSGKILLTREFRRELDNWDYRLPGGKVFDSLDEFEAFRTSGNDIVDVAKQQAINEAQQEAGVDIAVLDLYKKSTLGATVEWDLYVFETEDWQLNVQGQELEVDEKIEADNWVSYEEARQMILDGKMQEERIALILLQWLERQ